MSTLAQAICSVKEDSDGLNCPHGCRLNAWRMFGVVSHLMNEHGYTESAAWKAARKELNKEKT